MSLQVSLINDKGQTHHFIVDSYADLDIFDVEVGQVIKIEAEGAAAQWVWKALKERN